MIESTSNPHIKRMGKWKKSAKARKEDGVFLVEGRKMVQEAIAASLDQQTYLTEGFLEKEGDWLLDYFPELVRQGKENDRIQFVSEKVFREISDTVTPQGIICVVKRPSVSLGQVLEEDRDGLEEKWMKQETISKEAFVNSFSLRKKDTLLILEDVQDPGNLGTMLRTAEAAGVKALIVSQGCVDAYSPKVVRSTMGAIFRVPIVESMDWQQDLEKIKQAGYSLVAAHLKGDYMYEHEWTEKAAILIGNESKGLTEQTSKLADELVKIPMDGQVESLNAAVAAAILMYERRFPHKYKNMKS